MVNVKKLLLEKRIYSRKLHVRKKNPYQSKDDFANYVKFKLPSTIAEPAVIVNDIKFDFFWLSTKFSGGGILHTFTT